MIHSVYELIEYASRSSQFPGDVINNGTPVERAGTAYRGAQRF